MAPFVTAFPAEELPYRSQVNAGGKKRKGFDGELKTCELLEMMQYTCDVERPEKRESRVICFQIERLFRRCKDRNGIFMVETTALEGKKAG